MGIQQVMLAGAGVSASASITVGTSTGSYGYSNGSYGSFTGSVAFPLNTGISINAIFDAASGGSVDLQITATSIPGGGQLSCFNQIQVQDSTGTVRTYTASSSTYSVGVWKWGTGSSPVWTNTTANPRSLTMS